MKRPDLNHQLAEIDRLSAVRDAIVEGGRIGFRIDTNGNVYLELGGLEASGYLTVTDKKAVAGWVDVDAATEALRENVKLRLKEARRNARESLDEFLEGGAS